MRTMSKNRYDASLTRLSLFSEQQLKTLCKIVKRLDLRLAIPATSSNFSIRTGIKTDLFFISKSGIHKKDIQPKHFLKCDFNGNPVGSYHLKPSDETLLHAFIYKNNINANCVLHCHAPEVELLRYPEVKILGHELLKALGKKTHEESLSLNVYQNSQIMSKIIEKLNTKQDVEIGFVLEQHGIYVVGGSASEALMRLEALLHLFPIISTVELTHS
jgi:methylthioribulose-1-phosphate dehydratase